MRNKMITLCPTSYELSKKMPNFSAWVRKMVLENGQKTGMTKENRIMFHRVCGSDVEARWEHFTDGTYAWFGYCETCDIDVTWRPRQ